MYVRIYVSAPPKSLNGTLAVDSSFQTLVVDFSSNLYTSYTTARSINTFFIESRISLFSVHLALFVQKDDIIMVAESHRY